MTTAEKLHDNFIKRLSLTEKGLERVIYLLISRAVKTGKFDDLEKQIKEKIEEHFIKGVEQEIKEYKE